jgi:8-amino-7-oxononanoate synthase
MSSIKIRKIDFLPSRIAAFDGDDYLFFSGTSYLGVGHQADFRAVLSEGIGRYGTVFSASRNNNLQLKIYEEAEDFLAKWTGAQAALTVTSGLLAGQLAINLLKNKIGTNNEKTVFIYAPSAHPAVWEAPPQYIFKNQEDFEKNIVTTVEKEKNAPIVIVSNAVDMLTCQTFNFSWISQLNDNQDITLLIDDSHGIGITGENGSGIFQTIKNLAKANIKIVIIASLAKALGIPGGVILSDKTAINNIRQNPLFVGASPIVPAYLFAFLAAQPMYATARETLKNNIETFKDGFKNDGIKSPILGGNTEGGINFKFQISDFKNASEIQHNQTSNLFKSPLANYPVFFTPENALFDALYKEKIFISHFAYPKPNDPPITRVVLSALHTQADIEYLTVKINDVSNKLL